jgi:hypothetical protein
MKSLGNKARVERVVAPAFTVPLAGTFTTHSVGNFDVNVVRLGLNYKLDWWH